MKLTHQYNAPQWLQCRNWSMSRRSNGTVQRSCCVEEKSVRCMHSKRTDESFVSVSNETNGLPSKEIRQIRLVLHLWFWICHRSNFVEEAMRMLIIKKKHCVYNQLIQIIIIRNSVPALATSASKTDKTVHADMLWCTDADDNCHQIGFCFGLSDHLISLDINFHVYLSVLDQVPRR